MKRKRKTAPIVTVFLIVAVGVLLILAEVRVSNVRNELMSYAARNAALETKFNINLEDPSLVRGTITYIFKLK